MDECNSAVPGWGDDMDGVRLHDQFMRRCMGMYIHTWMWYMHQSSPVKKKVLIKGEGEREPRSIKSKRARRRQRRVPREGNR
jgi:hypothetical protein